MPISAPGRTDRGAEGGFTLIELLVVLVIMGLLSAAVVVALPDSRGSVVSEAQRFAARAKAAQDKAIIDGRAVIVRIDAEGYRFEQRARGEWRAMAEPYTHYEWTVGTAPDGPAYLLLDSTGLTEPARLILRRDEDQATVAVDAGGAIRVGA
ncbi:type II secretion system minor pseudopilin GspH [Allosphingosinicella vermicomposti]|uniref:type II secretion system minor pseudopilin GspH n=1 Tax=Allosphingosinicella vermicomposti TaxID=614671 RepID=UPI00131A5EDD|nr:type II secretion system minor pseudopilin GspH [Allosphingosinicella vermicomposti]